MFKRDKILVSLLSVLIISISFQFIGRAEEIPSSVYLKIKTDKEIYMEGERINFTVSIVNEGKKDIILHVIKERHNPIYYGNLVGGIITVVIYDSNENIINRHHSPGEVIRLLNIFPPLKINITVNATSNITKHFTWHQKNYSGQVRTGVYKAVFSLNLDKKYYNNSSLEGIKYFAIYPRPPKHDITGWIYLVVGLVLIICCLSVIITILFSRRRGT